MGISKERILVIEKRRERGADFSGSKLDSFLAVASRFDECRFEKMTIGDACFGGGVSDSEYYDCSFDGSKFSATAPGCARFVRCSFRNVLIREFFGDKVEFVDCIFSGKLLKGYFNGTISENVSGCSGRHVNRFCGNDFSEMELIDVGFRTGIDLACQRLPSGPNYLYLPEAEEAVKEARHQVIEWKNLELRREAMLVIQVIELGLEGRQKQLFLQTKDLMPKKSHEAAEKVFSLLRHLGEARSKSGVNKPT